MVFAVGAGSGVDWNIEQTNHEKGLLHLKHHFIFKSLRSLLSSLIKTSFILIIMQRLVENRFYGDEESSPHELISLILLWPIHQFADIKLFYEAA